MYTLKAERGEEGEVMTRSGTIKPSVLQITFELEIELVSSGLLESRRIRRIEFHTEAEYQIVHIFYCTKDQYETLIL